MKVFTWERRASFSDRLFASIADQVLGSTSMTKILMRHTLFEASALEDSVKNEVKIADRVSK